MRIPLRWVVVVPVAVWALDFAALYVMERGAGHSVDDTAYWGTGLSWLVNAGWVFGVVGSMVAVLLVVPIVLVVRVVRRRLAREEARAGLRPPPPDPEQRRWREVRPPRV